MNRHFLILLTTLAAVMLAGCENLARSRDLGNPRVPPEVTAVQVCGNCHGIDGNPVSPNFPEIAGQPKAYLVEELKEFRARSRDEPAAQDYMWGLAHHLTDEQINGLADYFSRQVPKQSARVDAQEYALGEQIYKNGIPAKQTPPCIACHGPTGQGVGVIPRLASQHHSYIFKQLLLYHEDKGRKGTPMQPVTHLMTYDEMKEVALYVQAMLEKPTSAK